MMHVRKIFFVLILLDMCAACTAVGQPPEPPSVRASRTALPGLTVTAPAADETTAVAETDATSAPLPIAVRLLTDDPHDVVLRTADLPDGFYVSAEFRTDRIELWPVRQSPVDSRPRALLARAATVGSTVTGYHVLLARSAGANTEGLVSLATTAVRYERTVWAADAFAGALANAPRALEDSSAMIEARTEDDASAWRYRLVGAVVDQVLIRARNYLLAITLVRHPMADEAGLTPRYAGLLRSKLRD